MYRSKPASGRDRGGWCIMYPATPNARPTSTDQSMPLSGDPLRYLSRNEYLNTGDRCASPFGLRGSSRQRTSTDRGSPGSLLSAKSKNTGQRLPTQSRRSAHSSDGSENVSGLALTIEVAVSDAKKRGLSLTRRSP